MPVLYINVFIILLPTRVFSRSPSDLSAQFPDVLGEKLGQTTVVEHCIETEARPIRQQPYRVPIAMKEEVKAELDSMLSLGIIQPSRSPWASPVVLVEKMVYKTMSCSL